MKKRIYIETTIVSYYTSRPSRDLLIAGHQEITHELWPLLSVRFEAYISALVYEEASKGDADQAQKRIAAIQPFPMLGIDDKVRELAEQILDDHGIPKEYPEDALHLAVAAVHGMDIMLTWNFAHLNNPFTRSKVRRIVEKHGWQCPEFSSPEELLEGDDA